MKKIIIMFLLASAFLITGCCDSTTEIVYVIPDQYKDESMKLVLELKKQNVNSGAAVQRAQNIFGYPAYIINKKGKVVKDFGVFAQAVENDSGSVNGSTEDAKSVELNFQLQNALNEIDKLLAKNKALELELEKMKDKGRWQSRLTNEKFYSFVYGYIPPNNNFLDQLAMDYHRITEAFDRDVCVHSHNGIAMPVTIEERRLTTKHALEVHNKLYREASGHGVTYEQWRKAVHNAARIFEDIELKKFLGSNGYS